tara:strand:+ start:432 stop:593 length:162 start_codon:yes stop_codon:yes gene_type:complete
MGKIKRWLMEMEEDATVMKLDEWLAKHGKLQKNIYECVNGKEEQEYANKSNLP